MDIEDKTINWGKRSLKIGRYKLVGELFLPF